VPDSAFPEGSGFDPRKRVVFGGKTYAWQPYEFSWRWGVEGDPGHQGYHGLKEKVNDEFIRLGKLTQDWTTTRREPEEGGTYYCLFTGIIAPAEGTYALQQGSVRPAAISINGERVDTSVQSVRLNAGVNTLMLWYDRPCLTYCVVRDAVRSDAPGLSRGRDDPGTPLATRWYGDAGILPFDARFAEKEPVGWYTFTSAPGMRRMQFAAHGEIEVSVGGAAVPVLRGSVREDGATEYTVDTPVPMERAAEVAIRIGQRRGYYGGAAIPDPVRLECGQGLIEIGDWSRNDALYAYSGGARYRTSVRLSAGESRQRIELDLGTVVSTAEVWVNGVTAGLRVSPPWTYDLSTRVREGENTIEVLVYNTAANHYTSIPTRYRGAVTSGILGPVTLNFTGRVVLQEQ
jgi:hypothetical protein